MCTSRNERSKGQKEEPMLKEVRSKEGKHMVSTRRKHTRRECMTTEIRGSQRESPWQT